MTADVFQNVDGLEILSNEQMGKADKAAVRSGVESFELMRRAGENVAHTVQKVFDGDEILVLAGPGNNGGDGFMAGSALRKKGFNVTLACLTDPCELRDDAAKARDLYAGRVYSFKDLLEKAELIENLYNTLVIDAVFGTGLSRALEEPVISLFKKISAQGAQILAVDIPSGIAGDSGKKDPATLPATHTVTFFRKKLGHCLQPGRQNCGDIHLTQIGIPDQVLEQTGYAALENAPQLWSSDYPRPVDNSHKYQRGAAAIFGGDEMTGAASMAAQACMRAGAGLCTVLVNAGRGDVYRSVMPPHIIVREDPEWEDERLRARLIGPGAGRKDSNVDNLVHKFLSGGCPVVIDADALLADVTYPDYAVLTPHEGEFARIFRDVEGAKYERLHEALTLTKAAVIYKGSDTLIGQKDHPVVINTLASPYLATAGTGDVLSGILTGLLAQGMPLFKAACASVYIHGKAGRDLGRGLVAADLVDHIPTVCKELNLPG